MHEKTLNRARRIGEVVNQMDSLQAELDLLLNEKERTSARKGFGKNGTGKRKLPRKATKIAKGLKAWRKDNALSLKNAAEMFGVSDATFSHWEHGKNEPKGENADRVESLLRAVAEGRPYQTHRNHC